MFNLIYFRGNLFIFTAAVDKLLVAGGVTTDGYIKDVEIIDLLNPENMCANLVSLRDSMEKTAAALVSEKPMICGNILLFICTTCNGRGRCKAMILLNSSKIRINITSFHLFHFTPMLFKKSKHIRFIDSADTITPI